MSDKPIDPAQQSINQSHNETSSYEGQQGYGVEYEDGQYRAGIPDALDQGHSGSYETNNMGGYGTGQPDATNQKYTTEQPASPPDPEADQGQGGQ